MVTKNRLLVQEGSDSFFLLEYDFYLIDWTRVDFAPQIQKNSRDYIQFDEPHPYPIRSFTYHTEHVRAYEVQRMTVYNPKLKFPLYDTNVGGPGSSVGIVIDYGLDGPVIESRWGVRFFTPVQTGPGAHPASCTMDTGSFPRVKSGRGVTLTPHPLLVPWSRESRAIPLLPSVPVQYSYTSTPLSTCTVQLYLYSPQCLYSTAIPLLPSLPVQYSYTSTPLSACTNVQFTFTFYLCTCGTGFLLSRC